MFGYLSHSLLLRAGLAMGLITALALGGMASAVFVARSTQGEAAAVNQAGSLRMQSYHIAAALEAGRNGGSNPFGAMKMLAAEFEHGGGDAVAQFWDHVQPILSGIRFRLTSTPLALAWLVAIWIGWRHGPGIARS